jgi:hypothetical protein
MLTGAHKTQRMASALTFLDQFQSHHIVMGYNARVSFVNVETKDQSKQECLNKRLQEI